MVKFIATNKENDRKIFGMGLSHGNIAKLMLGQPIHLNAEQLGLPLIAVNEILIFVGETEEAIAEEFQKKGYIDPDTPIRIDKTERH